MTLGSKLKQLRKDRGLYQKDVAERLGIALTTLSGYECDARKPDQNTLKALCELYGVTSDYLLDVESSVDTLEEAFPEGVRMLRRANNEMSEEQKQKLVKYMQFILEQENK